VKALPRRTLPDGPVRTLFDELHSCTTELGAEPAEMRPSRVQPHDDLVAFTGPRPPAGGCSS